MAGAQGNGLDLTLDRLIALRGEAMANGGRSLRGLTHFPGLVRGPKRGHGLDFDDLRLYAPGDDVRHIDWNVTARTGKPHTRLYREERERAMTIAVDFRASMFTGSSMLRAVAAGELAAAVLWQAARDGDRTGTAAWSGGTVTANRPASGDKGALSCAGLLADGFSQARGAAGQETGTGLDRLLGWINGAGRAAGAALLVTGLDEPGDGFAAAIGEAGKRRKLALLHILDPLEVEALPPGRYSFASGGQAQRATMTRSGAAAVLSAMTEKRERLHRMIEAAGVPVFTHVAGQPVATALTALETRGWL